MKKKPPHLPPTKTKPSGHTQPIAKDAADPDTELLTTPDVAKMLKVSISYLAKARMSGDGPPYVNVGRSVRYVRPGLRQWLKSRGRNSTSEDSQHAPASDADAFESEDTSPE